MISRKNNGEKKNRSKYEISAKIIESTINGAKKTSIMLYASLSYRQLMQYLEKLVGANLLVINDKGDYVATGSGKAFLKHYIIVDALLESKRDSETKQPQIISDGNRHTIVRPYS